MQTNKILLINPQSNDDGLLESFYPSLSLLALASALKRDAYDVKIIDMRKYNSDYKEKKWLYLKKELDGVSYVALTVMTAQVGSALEISKFIRDYNEKITLIWGGFHPSLFPKQTIEDELVDYIIIGEGDWSFSNLIKYLEGKATLDSLDGVGYKKKGEVFIINQTKLGNLDELPPYNWDLIDVESITYQRGYSIPKLLRTLSVQSCRGCPYQCTFCVNTALYCFKRWRGRNVELVLDEIEDILKKYKVEYINFRDELFCVSKDKIMKLCQGIIDRNLKFKWFINMRVNFFDLGILDDESMQMLKKAGLNDIAFGAESGSEKILKYIRKGITKEQLIKSAKMCAKYGITPIYSFMIGVPTETKEDMKATIYIMKDLINANPSSILLGPQLYRPYPGCELFNEAVRLGLKQPKTLREWPEFIIKGNKASTNLTERGFSSAEELPWIKDAKFIHNYITYARYMCLNIKALIRRRKYNMCIMSLIAKFRFRFNFWLFPYERSLRDSVYKFLNIKR